MPGVTKRASDFLKTNPFRLAKNLEFLSKTKRANLLKSFPPLLGCPGFGGLMGGRKQRRVRARLLK